MTDGLIERIGKFKDIKVAVVGDVMLDEYVYGFIERVNPDIPGAPIFRVSAGDENYILGGAGNVAANVSSLGGKVSLYGVIGSDAERNNYANLFLRECSKSGVNFKRLSERQEGTIVKQRFIEKTRGRYHDRIEWHEALRIPMTIDQQTEIYEDLIRDSPDVIILSDYNKDLFRTGDLAQKIIAFANEREIPVVVDPKPTNAQKFTGATAFCPNYDEAQAIIGRKIEDLKELAHELQKKTTSKYAVVTCGREGMVVYDGGFKHVPTKAQDVVDVTGAGDTAAATLALGIASGMGIYDVMHLANLASGIVVEKAGTAVCSLDELIERVKREG